jgi:hypothetical protein
MPATAAWTQLPAPILQHPGSKTHPYRCVARRQFGDESRRSPRQPARSRVCMSAAADEATPLLPNRPSARAQSTAAKGIRSTGHDPRAHASLLSRLTFSYLAPLFRKRQTSLAQRDIFSAPHDLSAAYNAELIFAAWDAELSSHPTSPSLVRTLYRSGLCRRFILAAPLKLLYDVAILATPVVFGALIRWFSSPTSALPQGFALASLLLLLSLATDALLLPIYFYECSVTGLRADRSLGLLLHRKALRLSTAGRSSVGELVSLLSVDTKSLDSDLWMYVLYLHLCIAGLPRS